MSFNAFGLHADLLRALEACGFNTPTEVQSRSIPAAMEGRDVMASAQTGTGKTGAFVLPTLHRLLTNPGRPGKGPRALVLTPTRELAVQVAGVVRDMSRFSRQTHGTIFGGVPYGPQTRLLRGPVDVLVATPGRLMDHMEKGLVDFSRLEFVILDEADRMLDMGFVNAVESILKSAPAERQTMLFSATLEGAVLGVAKRYLKQPERVELAAARKRHEGITQWSHAAHGLKHKKAMLNHLLENPEMTQAVVFTATKHRAKELAAELAAAGHASAPLHGNMTQGARRQTVDKLRSGRVKVLVATDVAARGLDVPGISHVINFELPMTPEDYIHRIGRTGRAGTSGIAITLVGSPEQGLMRGIERLTGQQVENRPLTEVAVPAGDRHEPLPDGKYRGRGGAGRGFGGGGGRRDERGGQSRDGSYAPRGNGYAPRNDGYAPRGGQARDGGYAPRNDGYAPRGGQARDGGYAPRNDGYAPRGGQARDGGYAPRNDGYAPRGGQARDGGYAPRNDGYAPRGGQARDGGYAPRNDGYAPRGGQARDGGYAPRNDGYAPRGGQTRDGGSFTPRNDGYAPRGGQTRDGGAAQKPFGRGGRAFDRSAPAGKPGSSGNRFPGRRSPAHG
ncbi:MAG: DEAD/DEAH box helicase [Nitrospirota bacterium]|nr:DEAD/DEAH box helicase [Nitrospirota bacterium]